MSTRLYFSSSESAPASPAWSSSWNKSTAANRNKLVQRPHGSALTKRSNFENVSTSPYYVGIRQFVSDPLSGAGTLSGTVSFYAQFYESAADADFCLALIIRVVSGGGSTVRGTALSLLPTSLANEFQTWELARGFSASSLSSVNYSDGDRIVVEVGYASFNTTTSSRTGYFWTGDRCAYDCNEALTRGVYDKAWIEFSQSLAFQSSEYDRFYLTYARGAHETTPTSSQATHSYQGGSWDGGWLCRRHRPFDYGGKAVVITHASGTCYWRAQCFLTNPLRTQAIPAGTWKVVVKAKQSAIPANADLRVTGYLYVWNADGTKGAEIGYTTEESCSGLDTYVTLTMTLTASSPVSVSDNDRIGLELEWVDDDNGVAGTITGTINYSSATDLDNCYIMAPGNVSLSQAGSTHILTGGIDAIGDLTWFLRFVARPEFSGRRPIRILARVQNTSGTAYNLRAAIYSSYIPDWYDEPDAMLVEAAAQSVPSQAGTQVVEFLLSGTALTEGAAYFIAFQRQNAAVKFLKSEGIGAETGQLWYSDADASYGTWPSQPTYENSGEYELFDVRVTLGTVASQPVNAAGACGAALVRMMYKALAAGARCLLPFGFSGTLDNFNRANGPVGSAWTVVAGGTATVSSNQLALSADTEIVYWNARGFGQPVESFVAIGNASLPTQVNLYLWHTGAGSGDYVDVYYSAGESEIVVEVYEDGDWWDPAPLTLTSQSLTTADVLGARMLADGSVEVYKNGTLIGTGSVAGFGGLGTDGYVGVGWWGGTVTAFRADDFGGGFAGAGFATLFKAGANVVALAASFATAGAVAALGSYFRALGAAAASTAAVTRIASRYRALTGAIIAGAASLQMVSFLRGLTAAATAGAAIALAKSYARLLAAAAQASATVARLASFPRAIAAAATTSATMARVAWRAVSLSVVAASSTIVATVASRYRALLASATVLGAMTVGRWYARSLTAAATVGAFVVKIASRFRALAASANAAPVLTMLSTHFRVLSAAAMALGALVTSTLNVTYQVALIASAAVLASLSTIASRCRVLAAPITGAGGISAAAVRLAAIAGAALARGELLATACTLAAASVKHRLGAFFKHVVWWDEGVDLGKDKDWRGNE